MNDVRKKLGWAIQDLPSYVADGAFLASADADAGNVVTIIGDLDLSKVKARLAHGSPVYIYAERIYKKDYQLWKYPGRLIRFLWRFARHKSLYLLSASAYAAGDFKMHGAFLNKAYKWGYFPECRRYNITSLIEKKNKKKIVWCGRFIDWKHPDDVLAVAKCLKQEGYDFSMDLIGTGEMESALQKTIHENELGNEVHILGAMKPEEVRAHMEQAGIYLFTSDFGEGWGAVLNESMNSGCAVVVSHAIGSVPYLMKHKENGLIYKNADKEDLCSKVKYLLEHTDEQKRLGENAYHTIADLWNAEVAAERFIKLAAEIQDNGYCDLFEEGPCSKAEVIRKNWFRG
jgi:glycosyltransferase involved in cell wall biosynthesis